MANPPPAADISAATTAAGCEAAPTDFSFVSFLATVYEHLVKLTPPCKGQITRFHAIKPPDISIKDYLERIQRYFGCSNECFVLSLVYIDRIVKIHEDFSVSILNVHRLLITSVMLAAKFFDDVYYSNAFYARVGGVRTREINILEAHFLSLLDFHLFVSPQEYDQYRQNVLAAVHHRHIQRPTSTRSPATAHPPQFAAVNVAATTATQQQQTSCTTSHHHTTATALQQQHSGISSYQAHRMGQRAPSIGGPTAAAQPAAVPAHMPSVAALQHQQQQQKRILLQQHAAAAAASAAGGGLQGRCRTEGENVVMDGGQTDGVCWRTGRSNGSSGAMEGDETIMEASDRSANYLMAGGGVAAAPRPNYSAGAAVAASGTNSSRASAGAILHFMGGEVQPQGVMGHLHRIGGGQQQQHSLHHHHAGAVGGYVDVVTAGSGSAECLGSVVGPVGRRATLGNDTLAVLSR